MAPSYRPYHVAGEDQQRKVKAGGKWLAAWSVLGVGGDPAEMKRRRRVASYKAYAVEGKVKASIRRGIRWVKAKCDRIAAIHN
ncbi:hypothetical protein Zm00014a_005420 [Zea mays]|mgnify:CR=1 FL=1|jgi:hypothetical protein|uniref:DUF3511 domain protein n=2 Tax=Zea mays TaxID=4577 RepID=B6TUT5_MAIZE|nr:uncharacterized protein LOC100277467 [Zea mays]ACG40868.1 hypothetical protein [Zea mays]ONM26322.1 DUF3511 domain protein [Zea mays]PWZ38478.1 hypothetical protein Zm00014a_005420 [Zea mays]|eukprot:XP_008670679.1 uncharacterized protein LOC100277467 [Zea mays]